MDNFNHKDEVAEKTLHNIGRIIKTQIPKGYGFSLILADYGDSGGVFYISSMDREGFVGTIKELLPKLEKDL